MSQNQNQTCIDAFGAELYCITIMLHIKPNSRVFSKNIAEYFSYVFSSKLNKIEEEKQGEERQNEAKVDRKIKID